MNQLCTKTCAKIKNKPKNLSASEYTVTYVKNHKPNCIDSEKQNKRAKLQLTMVCTK